MEFVDIKKLRKLRRILAWVSFVLIFILFLDFTGLAAKYLNFMAKMQILPAILSGSFAIVGIIVLITLVFGRIYCALICPLGLLQDGIGYLGKKRKRYRYRFSKAKTHLRIVCLLLALIALVFGGAGALSLFEPYSNFGRIVSNLVQPIYRLGNNFIVHLSDRFDTYTLFEVDVWLKGVAPLVLAALCFVVIAILSWKNGRTYCNTFCPIGTVLGFVAKFAYFKPVIVREKCIGCLLCAKECRSNCIDPSTLKIDYSRCVMCMDCFENCKGKAYKYKHLGGKPKKKAALQEEGVGGMATEAGGGGLSRRKFLGIGGLFLLSAGLKASEKKVDGGLAAIEKKKAPDRKTRIVPPGAASHRNMERKCTGCQLCVSACPNSVLRPSNNFSNFMQAEMSFERGYCRPECSKCSTVCPTGAIRKISAAEKTSIQVGKATFVMPNCITISDGVECGNCARHCPNGAISMVPFFGGENLKIPFVDEARCIGCGACEYLCPAKPFSAIYVEGNENHIEV